MYCKRCLAIVLVVCLTITPGCWSRKELNELAVVMALGIDKHEEGFALSAQVLKSSETGARQGNSIGSLPVITYESVGRTIPDAMQRMLSIAPRLLYMSHLRVLVFGEAFARQGVGDALDFISRYYQLRTDFFLLVAKEGSATDILRVATPFEYIPANSLHSSIWTSQRNWAATGKITLQHFVTELKRDGSNPVISGVKLHGRLEQGESINNVKKITPDTLLQHAGLGVFKDDRLVGWLGEPSSKTVNYVLNQVDSTAGFVSCPVEGIAGFQVRRAESRMKASVQRDSVPHFHVLMEVEADLNTVQCSIDLTSPAVIADMEKRIEEKYSSNLLKHITYVQKSFGSDVFGFGEVLHRQYPKLWKKYRDNWQNLFKEAKISVSTHVDIRRIGSIIQPLDKELKEP